MVQHRTTVHNCIRYSELLNVLKAALFSLLAPHRSRFTFCYKLQKEIKTIFHPTLIFLDVVNPLRHEHQLLLANHVVCGLLLVRCTVCLLYEA